MSRESGPVEQYNMYSIGPYLQYYRKSGKQ